MGGQGLVLNPGPVELPNLQAGYAWVGDATGVPQAVSTASLLVTSASFANNATSASFATTATSASYANNATSASFATTALSASFAPSTNIYNTDGALTGNRQITLDTSELTFFSLTSGSLNFDSPYSSFQWGAGAGTAKGYQLEVLTDSNTGAVSTQWNRYTFSSFPFPVITFAGTPWKLDSNGNHIYSGSINSNGNITAPTFIGNLTGTASLATNATSASFATTAVSASFANNATSASFAATATSASFASTASYWGGTVNQIVSGSASASIDSTALDSNVPVLSPFFGTPQLITGTFTTKTGYNNILISPTTNTGSITVVSGSTLRII
jgi:hypothetical protein